MIKTEDLIIHSTTGDFSFLVLFGSYSRGDFNSESDIDVIQIDNTCTHPYKYSYDKINYSVYSILDLIKMAQSSSLFILHVIKEGKVIYGEKEILDFLHKFFVYLPNYNSYRNQLKQIVVFLSSSSKDYKSNPVGNSKLLVYILRSCLYSIMYDRGKLTFSLKKIAEELKNFDVLLLESVKKKSRVSFNDYSKLYKVLTKYLGVAPKSPHPHELERFMEILKIENKEMFQIVNHFLSLSDDEDLYI